MDGAAPLPHDAAPSPDAPRAAEPLLDPTVLADMVRDFSDPAVVHRFARDFSATLEGKLERLERGIGAGDATGAEDAVLSVTTSAVMVGAVRLSQAARAVHRLITADDLDGARRAVAPLRACAADTLRELRAGYPESPEPSTVPL
ncbi:Hpt domain-containing protein [Arthrobacter sp. L77]|uniref:Hpt domain-containing protein n=1 Tax=Arthrobacter sp. L77 TaxID=1496689 RepID=UPI0006911A15|nr:Hpt domain-containing protein [Arthrobacter sp. L77]